MAVNKILFNHRYFTIAEDSKGVAYLQTSDNVLVVPLTARNEVILIGEPSPAFGDMALVLPGGEIEKGEKPADAANRELQEEIHYTAGRWYALGELRMDAKYNTRRISVHLARQLQPSRMKGDEPYSIRVGRVPMANFESLIASGRLTDASSIAALYMAQSFLRSRKTGSFRA